MTKSEKLQAIENIGITVGADCPCDYWLKNYCQDADIVVGAGACLGCWIKALEGVGK